jgi:hypothetical protein
MGRHGLVCSFLIIMKRHSWAALGVVAKVAFMLTLLSVMLDISTSPFGVMADDTKDSYGTVIGIDLGTTYSCVGGMCSGG